MYFQTGPGSLRGLALLEHRERALALGPTAMAVIAEALPPWLVSSSWVQAALILESQMLSLSDAVWASTQASCLS